MKGLNGADLERVIEHLGVILKAGKIDVATIEKVLSFDDLFKPSYTRLNFLEDLRLVADADGVHQFVAHLANPIPNFRVGRLYELQAAGKILRDFGGSTIQWMSKVTRKANGTFDTDFDFIIDGVYYQAKSGSIGSLDSVTKWIAQARADGATMIKYVTPGGRNSVPTEIFDAMAESGIRAEDIIDIAIP